MPGARHRRGRGAAIDERSRSRVVVVVVVVNILVDTVGAILARARALSSVLLREWIIDKCILSPVSSKRKETPRPGSTAGGGGGVVGVKVTD